MLWTWGVWDETRGKVTINWTETFNICNEMIEQLSAGLTEFSLQTENFHPWMFIAIVKGSNIAGLICLIKFIDNPS